MKLAARLERMGQPKYQGLTQIVNGNAVWNGRVECHEDALDLPFSWRKSRRVFVNSMSDLFHEAIPEEFIWEVFAVMGANPQHTFQVLTKRPERMREMLAREDALFQIQAGAEEFYLPHGWCHMGEDGFRYPLPNVWLGVSVEDRKRCARIDILRTCPAAVWFLSCEPLLEDLGELNLTGISWLICGAESGTGARPMQEDWVRNLRDQCVEAGAAFFYKQNAIGGHKIGTPELDGRRWMEFPQITGSQNGS